MAMAPAPGMEPAGSILELLQMHSDKFSTLLGVAQVANLTDTLADTSLVRANLGGSCKQAPHRLRRCLWRGRTSTE